MRRKAAQFRWDKEELKAIKAEVMSVYQDLESRRVLRDCIGRAECCQFHLTGRTPQLTAGEAVVAAMAWKASGRTKLPKTEAENCPFLQADRKCGIYDARPFGCRTHFCSAAGGPYSRNDVIDLIRRLESIDSGLHTEGTLPLISAIRKTGLLES